MFLKTVNLGLTVNIILGLFKQCSCVQIFFAFLQNERVGIILRCHETNSKIAKLDLLLQTIFW